MMAWSFIDSVRMLANAAAILQDKCIDGLELDRKVVAEGYVEQSLMNWALALAPEIGYENAARRSPRRPTPGGLSIREIALERTDCSNLRRSRRPARCSLP